MSDFKCVTNELRKLRPDIDDIRYVLVQDTYDGYVANNSNKTPKANCNFVRPDIVAVLNCGLYSILLGINLFLICLSTQRYR